MAKKRIDTAESDFVNHWTEQIRAGIEYRKKYSTRNQWDKFRRYYRGQWNDQIVPVNKIFSYGRMLMPRVYFRAPRVTVTAKHPEMMMHARVVEALDNLLIQELYLKQTLKMSTLDSFLCGVGPIKIGYDSEFGFIPEQIVKDGSTVTQVSTSEYGERIEYSQMVREGMPWALRERPEYVVVPWGSTSSYNLPWVAHYILRPLDDVKQDQKFAPFAQDLKGTRTPSALDDRKNAPFRPRTDKEKGLQYAELWEITDAKTKSRIIMCEDKVIFSTPDMLQTHEGLPWEFVVFNPDPEYFWAIPDAHIICPQQEELNEVTTQTSRHRSIALLKFLYKKGAITETEMEKFMSNDVGVGVAIEDVESIASSIMPLQPHIPPDLYKDAQAQIQAMREELGFSQNQEGAFSPYHNKTASESMIVNQSFEERVDERKDIIADVLVSIIRKWNAIIFKTWTNERVTQIIGPDGNMGWITYTGDQIAGDYILNIDADSGMPISRALKMQTSQQLFGAFNGDQLIDQIKLRQIMLDQGAIVDPRIPQLLQAQYAGPPQDMSMERQPMPMMPGGGKGQAGGRQGMTPDKPEEFESMRKRFQK